MKIAKNKTGYIIDTENLWETQFLLTFLKKQGYHKNDNSQDSFYFSVDIIDKICHSYTINQVEKLNEGTTSVLEFIRKIQNESDRTCD